MSFIAQLGGTEMVPTTLRVAALGLASYGALTWINKHYGVEILNAAPHRILAAGIIAVASEFALRKFSSTDAMHMSRLKASARALRKDLKKPEYRGAVLGIFNEDLGIKVSKSTLDNALDHGDFANPEMDTLVAVLNENTKTQAMIQTVLQQNQTIIAQMGPQATPPQATPQEQPQPAQQTEQNEAKDSAKIIADQQKTINDLSARLEALEAATMATDKKGKAAK